MGFFLPNPTLNDQLKELILNSLNFVGHIIKYTNAMTFVSTTKILNVTIIFKKRYNESIFLLLFSERFNNYLLNYLLKKSVPNWLCSFPN